jgi:hypothetical protein
MCMPPLDPAEQLRDLPALQPMELVGLRLNSIEICDRKGNDMPFVQQTR